MLHAGHLAAILKLHRHHAAKTIVQHPLSVYNQVTVGGSVRQPAHDLLNALGLHPVADKGLVVFHGKAGAVGRAVNPPGNLFLRACYPVRVREPVIHAAFGTIKLRRHARAP